MNERNQQFTPEEVDEQIDQLLHSQQTPSANSQMLADLSTLSERDLRIIANVRQRLEPHFEQHQRTDQVRRPGQTRSTTGDQPVADRGRKNPMQQGYRLVEKHRTTHYMLNALVAVFVLALLLSSTFVVFGILSRKATPTGPNQPIVVPTHQATTVPTNIVKPQSSFLYVRKEDGIYKVDPQSGRTLWYHAIDNTVEESVTVKDDSVYLVTMSSDTSQLLALSAQTGHQQWSMPINAGIYREYKVTASAVYVFVQDQSPNQNVLTGKVYALNRDNGKTLWIRPTLNTARVGAEYKNSVYIADGNTLLALDSKDGHELWHSTVAETSIGAFPQVITNRLYLQSSSLVAGKGWSSYYYAYDLDSHTQLWKSSEAVDASGGSAPTIVNGGLYTSDQQQGWVYAFDITNGKKLWQHDVGAGIASAPLVVGDALYIVESNNQVPTSSHIVALKTSNGAQIWSQSTGDFTIRQLFANQGKLYYGMTDSKVVVRNLTNGEQSSVITIEDKSTRKPTVTMPFITIAP
ncbi:hypothetical protein KDA_42020 [Dictyobacter alpinus]|uniref:Pyrrolo-quinoline quinone repeat domain-containing protein n=1 Tax=Dictyobacter alpinus TaxID=2014873 RepID=A0A402BBB4_9CHLR|nr:PQQ-binding-like beta-propeller repeat protein [Dictyobacter alpinus]GCE28718.1 hypothetical protein KDA_42020 [Dictyobacter alpinus]